MTEPLTGRTAWARSIETPLRAFLRTETGSAAFLLAATVAALAWVNADASSYDRLWETGLTVRLSDWSVGQDLRGWVNTGLMTFFFFVIGLEARREADVGELRERRRFALPFFAGLGGMAMPVAIYLAFNAGRPGEHGWGIAMSTDTAFALGMLALFGRRLPDRVRVFMLTVAVADDLVALVVIATAYTDALDWGPLLAAAAIFAVVAALRALRVRRNLAYVALGAAAWVAVFKSGVDPIVVGLVMGLLTYAYPAARGDLERATDLFRSFREQPTPELERSAIRGLQLAVSPNERLQQIYHPWTSYVIVPVFALANAGIAIDAHFLASAYGSPVTLGILIGYVVGKPLGITGTAWLVTTLTKGRLRPPVGWGTVTGVGTVAGIGFTVALLIAAKAFTGARLENAKLGVLSAALCSSILSWLFFRGLFYLPTPLRVRAVLGSSDAIVDLAEPVDSERDHVRGPDDAPVTLVEYGDFECPYCGRAEPIVRELLARFGDEVRYVWRHLPLTDVHPHAQMAALAAEAAAAQGAFWPMHDLLLQRQSALRTQDLIDYAQELDLDVERFESDLRDQVGATQIAQDVDSADLSGVTGTPTFFINELRHYGAYDIDSLSREVRTARARTLIAN